MGCDARILVGDWLQHGEEECERRLERCQVGWCGCGMLLPQHLRQQHEEAETELQEALTTWNLTRGLNALRAATDHLMDDTIVKAQGELWRLDSKIKKLTKAGVLENGTIEIDFDKREVRLLEDLQFTELKDGSVQLKASSEERTQEIVSDLVATVSVLQMSVVIQMSAMNRAKLVKSLICQAGVHPFLILPMAVPAAGQTSIIRPSTPREIFDALDTGRSCTISGEEVLAVSPAFRNILGDAQAVRLFQIASGRRSGAAGGITFPQFCDITGMAFGASSPGPEP